MTHAESVAVEHMAWRRQTGETWPAIYAEAEDALATVGMAMTGEIDTAWQAERAFALAYEAVQMIQARGDAA